MKRAPSPCAEFPNDNPDLHLGAIWVAEEPCDFPSPIIRQIVWESVSVTDVDTAIRMLDEEALSPDEDAALESALECVDDDASEEASDDAMEQSTQEADVAPQMTVEPAATGVEASADDAASVELAEQTDRCAMSVTMTHARPDDIVVEEIDFEDTVFESTESFSASDRQEIVFEADPIANARTESLVPPPEVMAAASATETVTVTASAPATATATADASTAATDPFTVYARIVAEIVLASGDATLATRLPTLLEEGDVEGIGDDVKAMLGPLAAWRGLIRGEEVDFSACGSSMLDEWTADLIARVMGAPDRAAQIKQELRRRGVAAFGLLEAA